MIRRTHSTHPLLAAVAALVLAGCGHHGGAWTEPSEEAPSPSDLRTDQPYMVRGVPAVVPDTLPSTVHEDAQFVTNSHGDLVSTAILTIFFQPGASRADREAAVHLIDGTVIGGIRGPIGDAAYYVQFEGDGTIARADSLAAVLGGLP